jgi:hypothetical protein
MAKISTKENVTNNDCFVIMPISDTDGYEKGHFKRVYDDIFKIAIESSGFCPVRADEVLQTNFIHLDILQKLIESPIAICDVSSRNPNVLFELGLRQAFDKPTVLVQEVGTQKIFDIAPLRFTEYRKELKYREVLEDQVSICEAIKATKLATDNGDGINSLISLLSLSSPATLKDVTDKDSAKMFQIMMSEINELRTDFRHSIKRLDEKSFINSKSESVELDRIEFEFKEFLELINKDVPKEIITELYHKLRRRLTRMIDISASNRTRMIAKEYLMKLENIPFDNLQIFNSKE